MFIQLSNHWFFDSVAKIATAVKALYMYTEKLTKIWDVFIKHMYRVQIKCTCKYPSSSYGV